MEGWRRVSSRTVAENPLFRLEERTIARTGEESARPPADEHEEIEVVEVPLADIPDLVRRGEIRHALMLSSVYLFDLYRS